MMRQGNISQMKEQEKSPDKELNEMEASNLPDAEFKTLVLRMFKELSETFNEEIGNVKKDTVIIK